MLGHDLGTDLVGGGFSPERTAEYERALALDP